MYYITQKIRKIFDLDCFVSMLKFDFDVKNVVSLLSVIVVSYIVLISIYKLITRLVKKSNKKSDDKSCIKTYGKYRTISSSSSSCSGCASNSSSKSSNKASKSVHANKKKLDKVLRKFIITA